MLRLKTPGNDMNMKQSGGNVNSKQRSIKHVKEKNRQFASTGKSQAT
jgi:hypothetical protein